MPVKVSFPIRIRTDAPAVDGRHDELLESVDRALGRALASCARSGVEGAQRLGAPVVRTAVRWSGDALPAVGAGAREQLEAELGSLIRGLVEDRDRARARAQLAGRADPVEAADEARLDPLIGLYTLPSYQGGANTTVPADQVLRFEAETVTPASGLEWEPIHSIEELARAFREAFLDHYPDPPGSGLTGAIFRDVHRGMSIAVWGLPRGDLRGIAQIGEVTAPTVDARHRTVVSRHRDLPPEGSYRLHYIAQATADNRIAVLTQVHQERLTALFRQFSTRPETMSDADFQAQLATSVENAIKQLAGRVPDTTRCFVGLDIDGEPGLLYSSINMPAGLDLELLPIVRVARHSRHGRRPGAAGSGGAGSGAPGTHAGTGGEGQQPGGEGHPGGEGQHPGGQGEGQHTGAQGAGTQRGVIDTAGPPVTDGAMFPGEVGAADGQAGVGSSLSGTAKCEPFRGEPSIEKLGAAGQMLRSMMAEVAGRLEISPCEYVGHFLISAASTLGALAARVGVAEINEPGSTVVAAGQGALGGLDFHPHASPQLQLLRHLAGTVPSITELSRSLQEVIAQHRELITDPYVRNPGAWELHFIEELHPSLDQAVGEVFKMTCRVVFLQLLNTSREAINDRRIEPGFTRFVTLFEHVVLPQLSDIDELLRLRERLQGAQAAEEMGSANQRMVGAYFTNVPGASGSSTGGESGGGSGSANQRPASWADAQTKVTQVMSPNRHLTEGPDAPDAYQTVGQGSTMRIRDRHGALWSMDAIEQSITLRRGTIESIEPLVKQFTDLPEVMERIRSAPGGVSAELARVLSEMAGNNAEISQHARDDAYYAFKAGRIVEDSASSTISGSLYALQGIHLLAHREIGEFFRGDPFYARGLDFIFSSEQGKRSLLAFGEFVGIVLLSVICAPAAIVAGIGLAEYHLGEAEEHARLYGALIDPEQVITYAEVEAELFAAELGLALSLVPVAGELLGEARAAFRVIASEAADVSEAAARAAAEEAALAMMRTAERGFVEKFVIEAAKAYTMQKVFELALAPIMAALEREWGQTGPIGGLERAMATLAWRTRARNAALGSGRAEP